MSSIKVRTYKKAREQMLPCFLLVARIRLSSATLCVAESSSHSPPISVGAGAHDSPFVRWIFRVVEAPTPTVAVTPLN